MPPFKGSRSSDAPRVVGFAFPPGVEGMAPVGQDGFPAPGATPPPMPPAPQGMPPQGMPPQGMPPQAMAPTAPMPQVPPGMPAQYPMTPPPAAATGVIDAPPGYGGAPAPAFGYGGAPAPDYGYGGAPAPDYGYGGAPAPDYGYGAPAGYPAQPYGGTGVLPPGAMGLPGYPSAPAKKGRNPLLVLVAVLVVVAVAAGAVFTLRRDKGIRMPDTFAGVPKSESALGDTVEASFRGALGPLATDDMKTSAEVYGAGDYVLLVIDVGLPASAVQAGMRQSGDVSTFTKYFNGAVSCARVTESGVNYHVCMWSSADSTGFAMAFNGVGGSQLATATRAAREYVDG